MQALCLPLLLCGLIATDTACKTIVCCLAGGWQLLSLLVHDSHAWNKGLHRVCYRNAVCMVLAIALSLAMLPFFSKLQLFLWLLLPVMSMIYFSICYNETYRFKRPSELI